MSAPRSALGRLAAAALLVLAAAAGAAGADAGADAGAAPKAPQPPVNVSSDEAEYRNAENLVIFTGKVVAVQADATLTADRLEVRFTPSAPGEGGAAPAGGILSAGARGSRIASMVSTGNVTFRQVDPESGAERYATGERGDYDAASRVMTLSGGAPRAWEGKNVMSCERMVFSLEDRNMKCLGKVEMKVYPAEDKPAAPAAGGSPAAGATPAGGGAPAAGEAPKGP